MTRAARAGEKIERKRLKVQGRKRERCAQALAYPKIICRYNRLPAGVKKVKYERFPLLFSLFLSRSAPLWLCYVDGVSLLIFKPLPAYLRLDPKGDLSITISFSFSNVPGYSAPKSYNEHFLRIHNTPALAALAFDCRFPRNTRNFIHSSHWLSP